MIPLLFNEPDGTLSCLHEPLTRLSPQPAESHILICFTSRGRLKPSPQINVFETKVKTFTSTTIRPWRHLFAHSSPGDDLYILYNPAARHVISDFRRGLALLVSLLRADNVGTALIPVPA